MSFSINPLTGQLESKGAATFVFDTAKAQGNIATLAQALVDPATNDGAWYVSTVAGTLSGTHSGSITVAVGDYVAASGGVYKVVANGLAALLAGAVTIGGNLTINGVDARLPNGGATFPTPESICTRARGDGRYPRLTELQNSNLTPFSFINATLSGSVSVIAGGFLSFNTNTLPATATALVLTRESPLSNDIKFNRGGWISFSVANGGSVASDETRELVLGGQTGDVVGTLARQSLGVRRVRAAGDDELFAVARNAGGEITPISMGAAVGNLRTDITIIWDTAGNVQWMRNGAVVATTASGPTGATPAALLIHQTHSGTGSMRGRWQPGYLYLP